MRLRTILIIITAFISSTMILAQDAGEQIYVLNQLDLKPAFAKGKMTKSEFFKLYQTYPEDALNKGVEGTVIMSLIVKSDGEPTQAEILQSADASLDQEAVRLASLLPYFTPGYIAGKPVNCKLIFTVDFILPKAEVQAPVVTKTAVAPVDSVPKLGTQTASTLTPDEVAQLKARIRTLPSDNNSPLYIVDGLPLKNDVNLNANTIESIRVIKGQKAMQFYGTEARNGVVIITTKNFPDKVTK